MKAALPGSKNEILFLLISIKFSPTETFTQWERAIKKLFWLMLLKDQFNSLKTTRLPSDSNADRIKYKYDVNAAF